METADIVVIGGGAFGLWSARACLRAGLSVIVADRGGSGASGGGARASETPVGALSPHLGGRPTPLKTFQLQALTALPEDFAALETETGLPTGFARIGRLQPLLTEARRAQAEKVLQEAEAATPGAGLRLLDRPGEGWDAGWLGPAPHGALHDRLSARIDPAPALIALRAACAAGGAQFLEGWTFEGWSSGAAHFDRGEVRGAACILAAGWESFAHLPGDQGGPEQGQAARLAVAPPKGAPLIGQPGLWIIPHAAGVAVGSTAAPGRTDFGSDAALEEVIARARALSPALRDAPVAMRWAGIRPRPASRAPVFGPVPGRSGLYAATGGGKIGLALAPAIGRAVAARLQGAAPDPLTETFAPLPDHVPAPETEPPCPS